MFRKQKACFSPPQRSFVCTRSATHIERVKGLKLLGIIANANFKFGEHVSKVLCLCSQRMYLLKQLKSQGLGIKPLHIVFTALIVSRVLYAFPAWGGFLSLVTPPRSLTLWICCETHITSSFLLMFRSGRCLHTLLRDVKMIDSVRSSRTGFNLPQCIIINCTNNSSSCLSRDYYCITLPTNL